MHQFNKIGLLFFHIFCSSVLQGQVIYGLKKYTEYHPGNLPVVISAPHGGSIKPSDIPDRTCNNATTVTDANTKELCLQIDTAFVKKTGCHPHLVICNLSRSKLDCNRNINDGACGNAESENAWNEFKRFIEKAQETTLNQYQEKSLYIDLHGHGNPIQRLELGYLLYDDELALRDSILDTKKYVNLSSIQNLVNTNANNYSHSQLLRGDYAFGTLMGQAGFPAVPSKQIPYPATNDNYFSGGYNTAHYSSYTSGSTVNGLQIECNYTNVRDNYKNRKKFADSIVSVIVKYLKIHQQLELSVCKTLPESDRLKDDQLQIFPNPASTRLQIAYCSALIGTKFCIMDMTGNILISDQVSEDPFEINVESLLSGIYILKLGQNICRKIAVNNY